MNTQINLRIPAPLLTAARTHAKKNGFGNVQEFIRETIREKLFDDDLEFARKVLHASKKKGLFGTEEELFQKLK